MADTRPEREIRAQVESNDESKQVNKTGQVRAEQPTTDKEIPDTAAIVREYAKWTDNDGTFHKVPVDGMTAIREPAHEQHELTIEDRDDVDQTLALKTPRRDNAEAKKARGTLHKDEIRNDEVHQALASEMPVEPVEKKDGSDNS